MVPGGFGAKLAFVFKSVCMDRPDLNPPRLLSRQRAWLYVCVAVLADITLALGYSVWCDTRMQRSADHADAAVVFYGGATEMDRRRVGSAVALWRDGRVDQLYFVGGARDWGSGSAVLIEAAAAAGVPRDHMSRDSASFDTETNVASLCRAIESNDWRRVALVSDAMHIVRIRALIARQCGGAGLSDAPTSSTGPITRIMRAHHEAIAWCSYTLPEHFRQWLVRQVRR